jgi:uracil phosphoribosyltransferase
MPTTQPGSTAAVGCVMALKKSAPVECEFFLGAVDEQLDDRGYICPDLGDAGDRQFGTLSCLSR